VIFNVSIVLLRATFLLATELLPLWCGLISDCGRLSTGLPPGWLIKCEITINLRSWFEEVCVLSLWDYYLGITFARSSAGTILHNILLPEVKSKPGKLNRDW